MILHLPIAIWFGMLTIISLFTTASLGIASLVFKKNVFNFHKFFAFTTLGLALLHLILGVMLWFFGVVI
jgi:hypothetical protein